jgi:hypothetical protein
MSKKLFSCVLIAFAVVLFFSSCKKDKPDGNSDVPTGIIKGQVVAENGTTPLPSVKVFVDAGCDIYIAMTNSQGYFILEAPAGDQVLNIQSGRGTIFRSQVNVNVVEKGVTDIPGGSVRLTQVANLAFIAGAYDRIETLIIDSLGYTATQLQLSDLSSLATLENYAAIFLNCGKPGALDSIQYDNLRDFVLGGGSLYASDFAVEYLTGDNQLFAASPMISRHDFAPQFVGNKTCYPRTGGFIDDNELCTSKEGQVMMLTGAAIVPTDLQVYLGKTSVDIEYDLGGWEVIKVLSSDWDVLVQDNTNGYGPLAIRRAFNSTSKSTKAQKEQGWVTICHIPPGNPNNPITITISINALPAHLAHGDYLGPCEGTGGQILFTTFHNHPYGHADEDIMKLLEYFIINL